MKQVFIFGEGHFERWDDFVQRMIYIINYCSTEREDWNFDDWTGGELEFVSKIYYEKGKSYLTN